MKHILLYTSLLFSPLLAAPVAVGPNGEGLNQAAFMAAVLPVQTSQAGKYLKTNGTVATWETVAGGSTAATTTFTPAGTVAATNVQAAIEELDTNKVTQLKCAQSQRVVLTKGAWNTVATLTGEGIIQKIWMAIATVAPGDVIARNTLIRIKFNGVATAQIGGASDVTVEDLFGGGLGIDREFRCERVGISQNAPANFSGHFKQIMPYTDGATIEIKPIGTTGTIWGYSMIQYTEGVFSDGALTPDWVLHIENSLYSYTAEDPVAHVMLNTNADTLLLGINHRIVTVGAGDDVFLENDYFMSADGGTTNFWVSSGTEDMFGGSFYFAYEPEYRENDAGLFSGPDDALSLHNLSAYVFFGNDAFPRGSAGLRVEWSSVNDPDSIPLHDLTSRATVFYYKKQ